jgi:hypothetical protein
MVSGYCLNIFPPVSRAHFARSTLLFTLRLHSLTLAPSNTLLLSLLHFQVLLAAYAGCLFISVLLSSNHCSAIVCHD